MTIIIQVLYITEFIQIEPCMTRLVIFDKQVCNINLHVFNKFNILPFFLLSLNYGTGIFFFPNKIKNWTFIHLWDVIDI